jgi:EmrB/QacA subfamily drug resistance transporter
VSGDGLTGERAPAVPAEAAGPRVRTGRILAVLIGAQLLIWIDNTILNVALKTLADPQAGLGATPEQLEWSLNSYTLVFAAFMLAGGACGDRFGRRNIFVLGLAIFGLASLWAAWSTSPASLIGARAVMGLGSALVVPTTLGVIRATYPEGPARSRAVALWSAASGLAIAIGPLLGGYLMEHFWWGSIFLVNVPVALVAVVAAGFVLPARQVDNRAGERPPLDVPGVLLSAAGLALLVYGIIEGGRLGDWREPGVWGPAAGGVVLLAVFTVVQLRARRPSFDVALFRNSAFTAAGVGVALAFFGLVGSMYYSVFYLQGVRGQSPLECGITLVPVAVGVLAGAPLGIALTRRLGPRLVAAPALLLVAGTLLGYAALGRTTPLLGYSGLLLAQGIGIGAASAPLTDAVVSLLPRQRAAAGAAITSVLRQVGAVLGVAVLGSLLAAVYRSEISGLTAGMPDALAAAVRQSAESARIALAAAGQADRTGAVDDAFVTAMHRTTVVAAVVATAGAAVVAIFMPGRARWAALRKEGEK